MFYAIMKTSELGWVEKFAKFDTKAEAESHVDRFSDRYPDAQVVEDLGAPIEDWRLVSGSWAVDPPAVDLDAIDQEALNATLTVKGSVLRAVVELLLERDTQMTEAVASATSLANLKASFPKPVTREQFVQALKRKMR